MALTHVSEDLLRDSHTGGGATGEQWHVVATTVMRAAVQTTQPAEQPTSSLVTEVNV